MKKYLLFFILLSFRGFSQEIPSPPNPPKLVNDFAGGVLSPAEIQTLEQKLVNYNDTTSTQIAVVIVKSVEPYEMNEYATKLGREWGVGGSKEFNNGVVVLWATEDRKVYIATGYGMEGALPDALAKRIIQNTIIPLFKESKFYDGLNEGTDEIFKYASGEYKAEPEGDGEIPFWLIVIVLIVIFIIIRSIFKHARKGGGGSDGGLPYTTFTGWGGNSGSWGGGWSSGGSGWGGGSSGGGGFGGFGGGSFGGGGAGGDY